MSEPFGYEMSKQQRELLADAQPYGRPLRHRLVVELPDDRSDDAVISILEEAAARLEILRTTFQRPVGLRNPVQVVGAHPSIETAVVDQDFSSTDALAPQLDLAVGPVLCARVGRRGQARVLVLDALAMVADVESLAVLGRWAVDGGPMGSPPGSPPGAEARDGGEPLDEAEEPLAYAEYAAWQAGLEADGSEGSAEAAAYAEVLRSRPPTELALLEAAAAVERPRAVQVEAGAEVVERLAVRSRAAGGEVADAWLALWAALIARVSGEDQVVIGVEVDVRQGRPELAGAVGPYRRMVPVVLGHAGDGLDGAVAQAMAARARALRTADWLPVEAEVDAAGALRPALVFSEAPACAELERGAVQLELQVNPGGTARVVAGERADAACVADFAAWLATLAAEAAAAPGTALARLPVLSPARAEALVALGHGARAAIPAVGMAERVVAWAGATPDAEAVYDGTSSLTYAELVAGAEHLANVVVAHAGPPGAPVALFLERSVEAVTALLAVLRAGGAYLPVAPDQPPARTAAVLADAGVRLVLTTEALAGQLPAFPGAVLTLEAARAQRVPAQANTAGELAYVLYTSGSTGAPKGVEVRREGLDNYVEAVLALLGPSSRRRRYALVSSLATDLGHTCLFPALVSGAVLDLVPADVASDPAAFAAWARRRPVDVLKITPSHLAALLSGEDPAVLPHEALLVGGEASSWSLLDRVGRLGSCRVINHYGPTEATVGCLVYDTGAAGERHRGRPAVPIGRPLPNTDVVVLGPDLDLVPPGAPGELCVSGAGLARGYAGDAERTAERFVPHPYRPGARLYRTGDQARMLSDGTVEFLGRHDGQVKIRGFRVECGEVEEALRQHPQVQRAAVVLREDDPGQARLVGYFASHFHPSPTPAELRQHLLLRLPEHMVPAAFVELETLPLTAGGKLDRSRLPSPALGPASAHEAPRNPTEERLAAIFAELLGLDEVGAHDDFFALGGHSLLATQVVVRARNEFDVALPVHALFVAPTVAALAAEVEAEQAATGAGDEALEAMVVALAALPEEEAATLMAETRDQEDH